MMSSSIKSYRPSRGKMGARYMAFGQRLKAKRYRSRLFRRNLGGTTRGRYAAGRELKFHDIDTDSTGAINATGEFVATTGTLVIIPQGVTEIQRIGRKCTLKKINWRFDITLPAAADQADPPSGDVVRVILYQDKQCNGAIAAVTDILETANYQSFLNLSNRSRFKTFLDRTYTIGHDLSQVDGTNTGSYPEVNISDSAFLTCNVPLEYDAAAGVITELRSNNICLLLLSKNQGATFAGKMRFRFEG